MAPNTTTTAPQGLWMQAMEPATIPLPKPRPLPFVSNRNAANPWQANPWQDDEEQPQRGSMTPPDIYTEIQRSQLLQQQQQQSQWQLHQNTSYQGAVKNLPSLLASRTDPFQARRAPTVHSKDFNRVLATKAFAASPAGNNNNNNYNNSIFLDSNSNNNNNNRRSSSRSNSGSGSSGSSNSSSPNGCDLPLELRSFALNLQANLFEDHPVCPAPEWDSLQHVHRAPPGLELEGGNQAWALRARGLSEALSEAPSSFVVSLAEGLPFAGTPPPPGLDDACSAAASTSGGDCPCLSSGGSIAGSQCSAAASATTLSASAGIGGSHSNDNNNNTNTNTEKMINDVCLTSSTVAACQPCSSGDDFHYPSKGSLGHFEGICRPCDFTGRGFDCRAGSDCQFCHLCGPQDRKLRKAQRKKMIKAMLRAQVQEVEEP